MKLLTVNVARAVWLFPLLDINPRGRYEIDISDALVERYRFRDVPDLVEASKKNEGIKFGLGFFDSPTAGSAHVELGLYTDGLVAECRESTETAEEFLTDLLDFIVSFDFVRPPIRRKLFVSELYVSTEHDIASVSDKMSQFAREISGLIGRDSKATIEPAGLWFAADFGEDERNPFRFRFERAEGVGFSEKRYYSYASIPTRYHLQLLDRLEAIMAFSSSEHEQPS